MRALAAIFLMFMLGSCFNQGDCLITNTNIVKVSLRAIKDKALVDVHFDTVAVLNDRLLYVDQTAKAIGLPVNPGVTEMTYVFAYGDNSDTLSLAYDNQTIVLDEKCGAFPYQRNLVVTHHTFGQDNVVVVNQSLLRSVPENITIYF